MNLLFNIKSFLIYIIVAAVGYLLSPMGDDILDIVFAFGSILGFILAISIILLLCRGLFLLVPDTTKIHLISSGILANSDRKFLEMVTRGMRSNTRDTKEVAIAKAVLTTMFGRDNKWWLQEIDQFLDKGLYDEAADLLEENMGPSRLSAYIRCGYWHPLWWF